MELTEEGTVKERLDATLAADRVQSEEAVATLAPRPHEPERPCANSPASAQRKPARDGQLLRCQSLARRKVRVSYDDLARASIACRLRARARPQPPCQAASDLLRSHAARPAALSRRVGGDAPSQPSAQRFSGDCVTDRRFKTDVWESTGRNRISLRSSPTGRTRMYKAMPQNDTRPRAARSMAQGRRPVTARSTQTHAPRVTRALRRSSSNAHPLQLCEAHQHRACRAQTADRTRKSRLASSTKHRCRKETLVLEMTSEVKPSLAHGHRRLRMAANGCAVPAGAQTALRKPPSLCATRTIARRPVAELQPPHTTKGTREL